ncbi:MAG TPA: response regulator [bacterium]|nr:response regulator [bacterium]HPN43133.1 response regulator [bacterium]
MRKQILVVDDEKQIRDILELTFKDAGFFVRCAGSGEEAIELFKNEDYVIVFLDVKLPGLSGFDICSEMKRLKPQAYIVAMTGYTDLFNQNKCMESGFDYYFPKPFKFNLLMQLARDALEKIEWWKKV